MKIRITTLAVLATSFVFTSMNPVEAGGCGGRGGISIGIGGGGISIGHSGGHGHGGGVSIGHGGGVIGAIGGIPSHQHNSQPVYHAPQHIHHAPSYPQPAPPVVYSQPSYPQPVYSQAGNQQSYPQGVPAQQGTNVSQMNGVQGNVVQNNSNQPVNIQSMNPNMQPSQNGIAQAPQNASNAATQQLATQQLPVSTSVQPQAAASAQAESSALQLLASMNGDMAESANAALEVASSIETAASVGGMQPSGAHVGAWRVVLPGNQTITLVLTADNNFQWNAIKDGKSSSFQGQYIMDAGRLTLVRSTDLQQMAGSWTSEGANFTFKLDGATSSGLAFARAQ